VIISFSCAYLVKTKSIIGEGVTIDKVSVIEILIRKITSKKQSTA